jgi:hypothetical protein
MPTKTKPRKSIQGAFPIALPIKPHERERIRGVLGLPRGAAFDQVIAEIERTLALGLRLARNAQHGPMPANLRAELEPAARLADELAEAMRLLIVSGNNRVLTTHEVWRHVTQWSIDAHAECVRLARQRSDGGARNARIAGARKNIRAALVQTYWQRGASPTKAGQREFLRVFD